MAQPPAGYSAAAGSRGAVPPDFERWHGALERFRVWGLGLDFLGFRVRVFGFKGLFRRLRFKGQHLKPGDGVLLREATLSGTRPAAHP